MSKSVLAISWLNGQVTAVHCRGERVMGRWTCPVAVDSIEEVQPVVAAAVHDTQFKGREVVFVVENRNLIYHLQEAPVGRRALIRSFLERKVAQSRFFEEEPAVFGMSAPMQVKNSQRFLLTVLPRHWLLSLRDACIAEGLRLSGVFSPASVLAHHLNRMPVDLGQPVMMTSDLGGTLCLVVARKDKESQVLFARTVTVAQQAASSDPAKPTPTLRVVRPGARESDRLEQEINRTRLFSQQQFETNISQFWVVGAAARAVLENTRLPEGVTLHGEPVEEEEYFLAREGAQLTSRTPGNLLGQLAGEEQRQRRVAALALGIALAASTSVAGWTTHLAHARDLEVETLRAQTSEAEQMSRENIQLWEETARRQLLVSSIGTPDDPPIPLLFLRYLGARLPDSFFLHRFDMNRSSNRWQLRIEGRQSETPEGYLSAVQALEGDMTNSQFKVQILTSTRARMFQEVDSESRVIPTVTPGAPSDSERPFFVEGIIP
jgi:hypothetical protein